MQIDKSKLPENIHHLVDMLMSPEWPEAVPPFLICSDSEEDKFERAEGIIDYVSFDLKDKKICDFGCGEGHLAIEASKVAAKSIGYDVKVTGIHPWEVQEKYLLTTNIDMVKSHAPYDYVILYDVLDHSINPISVLKNVFDISHNETKIFVRCHSWMSRHGGHTYRTINKAWVHLVFTEEELKAMDCNPEFSFKYYTPIITQKEWFNIVNLTITESEIIKTVVEPFFRKPEIMARLPLEKYKGEFPEWQMSQVFNDYFLKK